MEHGRRSAVWLGAAVALAAHCGTDLDPLPVAHNSKPPDSARADHKDWKLMEAGEIMNLMARFLNPDFDLDRAQQILGTVARDSNPNLLELAPKSPIVESALLDMGDYKGDRFVGAILIRFARPVEIDLRPFVAAYGPHREGVRLKPSQPIPHVFDVSGGAYPGTVTLGLDPGNGDSRTMRTLELRRLPEDL